MLVFGTSVGKTYAIQCLLSELGRAGQNSLIIDYTDGFIPSKLEKATTACLKPKQHFIQQSPLPINPFKGQVSQESGMIFKDTPISIAKRVAAIFTNVYGLGNQQFLILIDAIAEGVQQLGENFRLANVLVILQTYIDDGVHSSGSVKTTISKLKQFIWATHSQMTKMALVERTIHGQNSRCHVFQFHMVDRHSARAVSLFLHLYPCQQFW